MPKVSSFLTFRDRGEEAVNFYVSLIKNSKVLNIVRYGDGGPLPKGSLLNASFQLDGQHFMAMDGGSHFSFSEGFSLFVNCETQQEIDQLWDKLSDGGEIQMCGWLKDKYGMSWQIVPSILGELMQDKDRERSKRVMEALLQMKKLDIDRLKRAYEGK
jgi:predicted 3-demethylubiquinone-9 3-methyltransferase (glyoxalase superfamily)